MPSEVLDDVVVSIAEVRQEVMVADQVARFHLPMRILHLRMVCSWLRTFRVICAP